MTDKVDKNEKDKILFRWDTKNFYTKENNKLSLVM